MKSNFNTKCDKAIQISFLEKYTSFLLPILLLLADYFAILIAEYIAFGTRKFIIPLRFDVFFVPDLYFYVFVPLIFLAFLHFADTYIRKIPFWQMAQEIFKATIYSIFTVIILMYFGGVAGVVSRVFVFLLWICSFLMILTMRYCVKKTFKKMGVLQIPVIIIGAGKTAELMLRSFDNDSGFGYKVVGIIDDHPISNDLAERFPLLGTFTNVENVVRESGIQSVIIAAPGLPSEQLIAMINKVQLYVKNVAFIPDLRGTPVGNLELENLFDEKIILLKVKNNLARRYNRIFKMLFDISISLVSLIFLVPLGGLLSILIYLDSPGTIMFAHQRVGKHGKMFPCYKFRTMVTNAQEMLDAYLEENPAAREEWNRDFKLKDDPRITRIGKFLRKTSLDELPQILNVIKGEMSLVGPRPIVTAEIERYADHIYDYYLVPPGITGMWQVNGRSDTTYDERVEMDSWYVRNWSVWIDIVYLLKTVGVVLKRKGAY